VHWISKLVPHITYLVFNRAVCCRCTEEYVILTTYRTGIWYSSQHSWVEQKTWRCLQTQSSWCSILYVS